LKIIDPHIEMMTHVWGQGVLKFIEQCGRVCYKSEDKMDPHSAEQFVRKLINSGHESVLEHYHITVKIVCDRGVSHEIVRHRIGAYSQESTRYCNYGSEKMGGELTFISPLLERWEDKKFWESTMQVAEEDYLGLISNGVSPQIARSVLPNSLKTEIVVTYNLRQWRHFLKQRTSRAAHPQMREIAYMILEKFKQEIPVVFDDIGGEADDEAGL